MAKNDVVFTSHIDAFYDEFDEAVEKALYEVGEKAEGVCKKIIKRTKGLFNTGRLRNSITHAEGKYNGDPAVAIGTNVHYAPYLELGTGKYAVNGDGTPKPFWYYKDENGKWHKAYPQKPKPFLRPTVEDKQFVKKYKEIFEEELGKIK